MKITVEYLKRLNACKDQVDLFAKTFPDGAKVTRDNLAKARAAGLNVEWFAAEVYRGAVKSALINYHDSARKSARDAYDARKVAGAAYDAAIAAAWTAYDAAIDDIILDVAEYRRTLKNYHDQRSLQNEQDK